MFFANIFDSKIVDDQQESDVFGSVFPKLGRTRDRRLSKLRKVDLNAVVGDASSLIQIRHAFAYLHVDPPI